jgi:cellulose synthase/poly-beta-1,6-N-acetylglucosamine synthase-like glycosyltransferase
MGFMIQGVGVLLLTASVVLLIPVVVLLMQVLAAVLPWRVRPLGIPMIEESPLRIAVLVPAHDESVHLIPTLGDIRAQLGSNDRVIVVADNCSDDTAEVAASAGAQVVLRRDASRVGKGYALDHGIRHLASDPPDIVVIIDADCHLSDGALAILANTVRETGRPAQALDLMTRPHSSSGDYRFAEFAWRLKNWLRPLGYQKLGLPCQMMGTGMAFPWAVIREAELANGHVAEDLLLGFNLTAAGHAPTFCPRAVVTSTFPASDAAAVTQRQRWEHGHLDIISRAVPQMLFRAIRERNRGLLAVSLDASVPPLSLLAILLTVTTVLNLGIVALGGATAGLIVALFSLVLFGLAVVVALSLCGRDLLSLYTLISFAPQVYAKGSFYFHRVVRGPTTRWVRTDRD